MSILEHMKLDVVYEVKESRDDTLLVGDLIWLASTSPRSINCIQARGFLDDDESEAIYDVVLAEADGWSVETNKWHSKAYRHKA